MNKIKSLLLAAAIVLAPAAALASLPWGTTANTQQLTGSTPSPTAFPTVSGGAIIDLMTGNTTLGALSGGTSGGFYTIVFLQDGTGGRTLTVPASLTGMPASIPTAANQWTACVVQANAAASPTTYAVQACYDNYDLTQDNNVVFAQTTAGTAIANTASQVQASIVVPGATAAKGCVAMTQGYPATWQVGIGTQCVAGTNFVNIYLANPTAATQTATATTVTVRFLTK